MVADNRNVFVTMTLRDQMTGKAKKIEGSLASVRKSLDQVAGSGKRTETSFLTLTGNVLKAAPAFAVATAAITSVYQAMRLLREEVVLGLKAVEDYNIRVASMTGFLTQFSDRTARGDLAGGFREANRYAELLVERLEILDARTIASGKELTIIAETFIKNRQVLDVTNKEQEQAFLNIVNATKLLTQGQNQQIQLRQEINALVKGEVRPTNMLVKLLQAQNPKIQENLRLWAKQGTVIQNVGNMLQGMEASTVLLEATWSAIGSTMATIHEKVLRGGFAPVYKDLLGWAQEINAVFLDQNGNLTKQSLIIQQKIGTGWEAIKEKASFVYSVLEKVHAIGEVVYEPFFIFKNLLEGIAGYGVDFAKNASAWTISLWESVRGLDEIEKNYKNIAQYSKAIAAHNLIMQGNTQLVQSPFFEGLDIAGEMGLEKKQKPPKVAPQTPIVDEKNLKRIARINDEYMKDLTKAWEDVTLGVLPEHERKVESIVRKYDKMRESALIIYGDTGDFALLKEHLKSVNDRQAEQIDKLKETNELANDLGFTFASSFEDAVIAGKELSDVLKGLEQDILRVLLRRTITEPLANAATGILNQAGAWLAGTQGMADGGVINEPIFGIGASGQTYAMGEGYKREYVVPEKNMGGVVNYFTIDARGADAGVESRIRQAIQIATNAGYNKVAADIAGRGPISQAIR